MMATVFQLVWNVRPQRVLQEPPIHQIQVLMTVLIQMPMAYLIICSLTAMEIVCLIAENALVLLYVRIRMVMEDLISGIWTVIMMAFRTD